VNGDLIIAFLCLAAAVIIGVTGILIDRPEKPKARPRAQHSKRGQRRAARAAERAEDDQTVAWLAALKRPLRRVPAQAIARARVAGLLAVLPARRAEPPCPRYAEPGTSEWPTTPGPWDTDEARAELVPLPPLPVDLGELAGKYRDIFRAESSWSTRPPRPDAELTVVDLKIVGPPPFTFTAGPYEYDDSQTPIALPGPNAAAGNWTPRAAIPGPVLDWDPAVDDPGLIHLRYPWADQVVADFDRTAVSRG
jgi:hypothetical protein